MSEEMVVTVRLNALLDFAKKYYAWFGYAALALITYLAVWIRMLPISGLRDVSTGGWTLGPDLDPFLFLRWAKYIVAHGSLMAIDTMRNVPLGFPTNAELTLLPYLIAWFHKAAVLFGSTSVDQSAAVWPVFIFALTVIAFFFFVRETFSDFMGRKYATIASLIACVFLSVFPVFLPRAIAGIPEKEGSAFFFIFLAFYFFILSWKAKSSIKRYSLALAAGIMTACASQIWGGVIYVFVIISMVCFFAFLLGQVGKERLLIVPLWFVSSVALVMPFSGRYTLYNIITSESTSIPIFVCFILFVDYLMSFSRLKTIYSKRFFAKLPPQVVSLIIAIVFGILLGSLALGPSFLIDKATHVLTTLIHPFAQDRWSLTVAENKMPYFAEWASNFGPYIGTFPITFWMFFFGSIYLFYMMFRIFDKKDRYFLTFSYTVFLFALIFSRWKADSVLNGADFISNLIYFGGMFLLVCSFGYFYYKYHREGKEVHFANIDIGLLILFAFFFISIVSARGGIRLVLVMVPSVSMILGFSFASWLKRAVTDPKRTINLIAAGIILVALLFSAYQLTLASEGMARSYIPSVYTQQWQYAMQWVRDNTPENAVFAHWWDYGYWVQSIGNRATVLDGGNIIVYWNFLMGRYALTGNDSRLALDYLYAHNATHFLIDSSDIGKYPAFSSIGSDQNYDRYSWLPTFMRDDKQAQEVKNATYFIYTGGTITDGDIIFNQNDSRIFLPEGKTVLAGIILGVDNSGVMLQPQAAFIYQNNQYRLPLRYAYNGSLVDFGSGYDAGVFLMPYISSAGAMQENGALIYLSSKVVHSQLARLYLFNLSDPYFKLVHTENDYVVKQLKAQNPSFSKDFVVYGDVRGPIKIWSINYPDNMVLNKSYLETKYPDLSLTIARQ
jgi:asparagine N-glycosylation enzyme membrane subunit Stt3